MNIMVDYVLAEECKNPDAWYMCHNGGNLRRAAEGGRTWELTLTWC